MKIDRIINRLIEFGYFSNKNSLTKKFSVADCVVQIKSNINHEIDAMILSAFFTSAGESNWNINIWCNNDEFKIGDILSYSDIKEITFDKSSMLGKYKIACDPSGAAIYAIDYENKQGSIWISDQIKLKKDFFLTPFRAIISWIIGEHGGEILHGAGIEIENRIIVLSGVSGSGKSVLTHKAISQNLNVIGDDAIAVMPGGIFPIYTRTKLNYDIKPEYVGMRNSDFINYLEKRIYTIKNPISFLGKQIDYLIFPKIMANTKFIELDKSTAIKKLILENCTETIGINQQSLTRLTKISAKTKAYNWHTTTNVTKNIEELRKFIKQNVY